MIGRMPLSHIIKNGVDLNRKEMSKEELSEVRLRARHPGKLCLTAVCSS